MTAVQRELLATSEDTQTRQAKTGSSRINVGLPERLISLIGGGALVLYGLRRGSPAGIGLVGAGGYLVYRGMSGHCEVYRALGMSTAGKDEDSGVTVEKTVTVQCAPADAYRFWHDFEQLPHFMQHLESVRPTDGRYHWVARLPMGGTVEWDAEITADRANELIAWRSLPGSDIEHAGSVHFKQAPGGRGTEVAVRFEYKLLPGSLGTAVTKLVNMVPAYEIKDDLRRFKQMIEAGEVATITGQTSGRVKSREADQPQAQPHKVNMIGAKDLVQVASEGSFPASDPPSWTTGAVER